MWYAESHMAALWLSYWSSAVVTGIMGFAAAVTLSAMSPLPTFSSNSLHLRLLGPDRRPQQRMINIAPAFPSWALSCANARILAHDSPTCTVPFVFLTHGTVKTLTLTEQNALVKGLEVGGLRSAVSGDLGDEAGPANGATVKCFPSKSEQQLNIEPVRKTTASVDGCTSGASPASLFGSCQLQDQITRMFY